MELIEMDEVTRLHDEALRERCVNIAWQMASSDHAEINTFQLMLETADALFKYIKSGIKGE